MQLLYCENRSRKLSMPSNVLYHPTFNLSYNSRMNSGTARMTLNGAQF